MAAQDPAPQTDKDLSSIGEARTLARAARTAQPLLAELTQEAIDAVVTAMADAVRPHAEALARMAVDETGFGVVADKVQKNLFASRQVFDFIRPMKTVGVVNRLEEKKIIDSLDEEDIARLFRRSMPIAAVDRIPRAPTPPGGRR